VNCGWEANPTGGVQLQSAHERVEKAASGGHHQRPRRCDAEEKICIGDCDVAVDEERRGREGGEATR
jgi:hypothetical protein